MSNRTIIPFTASASDLADGDDLLIGEGDDDPAVHIHTIAHEAACDVILERTDGSGEVQESIPIDSFTGSGISQNNGLEIHRDGVSQGNLDNIARGASMRLRIRNTSGAAADYVVTGEVVGRR